MAPARSLHEIFAGLTGTAGAHEAGDALRHGGHADLPAPLLGEALVSYAGTAPIEVAAQLAPFVTAHTGFAAGSGDQVDPAAALDLLAAAPPVPVEPPDGGWEEPIEPPPAGLASGGGEATTAQLDTAFGSGGAAPVPSADLPGPAVDPHPGELPGPAAGPDPAELADPWPGLAPTGGLADLGTDLGTDLSTDLSTDLAADLDEADGDADDPGWG